MSSASEGVAAGGDSDLVAAQQQQSDPRRVAVSGLAPQGQDQQQQSVGVPPAEMSAPPPTLLQKAKAPFMGVTLLATAGVAAWQSNRMYKRRQEALLTEFGASMVFHIADVKEMKATVASFRKQLGPGKYTGRMFETFLKAMANDMPVGVQSVKNLKQAVAVFGLTDSAAAKLLEAAADDLGRQPSVLGKLTFLAERAMPTAASMAKLRTKFPNWSFDTVTALQRAMLENLYRELTDSLPRGSTADAETLDVRAPRHSLPPTASDRTWGLQPPPAALCHEPCPRGLASGVPCARPGAPGPSEGLPHDAHAANARAHRRSLGCLRLTRLG
jgi:hypothetical protein